MAKLYSKEDLDYLALKAREANKTQEGITPLLEECSSELDRTATAIQSKLQGMGILEYVKPEAEGDTGMVMWHPDFLESGKVLAVSAPSREELERREKKRVFHAAKKEARQKRFEAAGIANTGKSWTDEDKKRISRYCLRSILAGRSADTCVSLLAQKTQRTSKAVMLYLEKIGLIYLNSTRAPIWTDYAMSEAHIFKETEL